MSKRKEEPLKSKFIRDTRCTNDIGWYKNYDTLTKDVASVFMSRPNGVNYPSLDDHGGYITMDARNNLQGGMLVNYVIPWFGSTPNGVPLSSTALNTAASKLYYYVVHGNSRNVSYDKGDLMRCLMTYDGIYCAIHEAIRAYKFIKYVTVENKWAASILQCLNFDPDDLKANVVQFRTQINLAIQKLNQLSLPDIFAIHKCHAELFDYVYRDRPGEKSQFMANVPRGHWMYFDEFSAIDFVDEYVYSGNTINVAKPGRTVADFTAYINFMLHTLYDSTDMGVMQADIRKAFSDKNFITMYMLEEDNDVPIVFDEEYNLKLHNMEIYGPVGTHTFTPVLEPGITSVSSLAVIHDQLSGDPNMSAVVMKGCALVNNERAYEYANHVHIMDLPDDYRQDVDCVLLMQTMKVAGGHYSRINWHLTDGTTEEINYPEVGAVLTTHCRYFSDFSSLTNGVIDVHQYGINPVNISTPALAWQAVIAMHYLWELAITLQVPWVMRDSSGPTSYALKPQMEVENVTVYSNDVLRNILNVITESLWYASELYNGTT